MRQRYPWMWSHFLMITLGTVISLIPTVAKLEGFEPMPGEMISILVVSFLILAGGLYPLAQRILARAFGMPKLFDDIETISAARNEYHRAYADVSKGVRAILREIGSTPKASLRTVDQVRRELERLELDEETEWTVFGVHSVDSRVQKIRERAAASRAAAAQRKTQK